MSYRIKKSAMLVALALAVPTFTPATANGAITIDFTGLMLEFDNGNIYDDGATPLGSINIYLNYNIDPVASLSDNVWADVLIQGVPPIPTGGWVYTSESFVELLSAGDTLLKLSADQMTISYSDYVGISGIASDVIEQNLPGGLIINPGSEITILLTGDSLHNPAFDINGSLTGFDSSTGTGQIEGELVPEPASFVALLALGAAGLEIGAWKKRRRGRRSACV